VPSAHQQDGGEQQGNFPFHAPILIPEAGPRQARCEFSMQILPLTSPRSTGSIFKIRAAEPGNPATRRIRAPESNQAAGG
jgi:hypothetical protein